MAYILPSIRSRTGRKGSDLPMGSSGNPHYGTPGNPYPSMDEAKEIDRKNHLKTTESMVGTVKGYDDGNLYLSAESSGGGEGDSAVIPHILAHKDDRLPGGKFADGQRVAATRDHPGGDKYHAVEPFNPKKHGDWPGA